MNEAEKEEQNQLILFDRMEVINLTNAQYNLFKNAYISFSGGKDSTILHYLIDIALPENKIPRVFIDTGIEYNYIRDFVFEMAKNDDRFIILKSNQPIKNVLNFYGYPFKSKEHSAFLATYQRSGLTKSVKKYLSSDKKINCPINLRYQFTPNFKIKCSSKCCYMLKKNPVHKWEKEFQKTIAITGMRKEEGGQRSSIKGCLITENGKLKKFQPLLVVSEDWEEWFIKNYEINLCKLYYPPFNFKRTGCKGCPYSLDLQNQLDIMEQYLPAEKKQCEFIWQPIYAEYRRIGYRLKNYEQLNLFKSKKE